MPAVIRRASDAEFTLADGHRIGVQYGEDDDSLPVAIPGED
jgi:hypothetical protein